ncbi:MAG: glycosyltransferase family 4 protein [Nitrospirae bacterium]|nr:glycosyltransferase family 4 protein [Nitrospirota bacterium]
MKKTLNIWIVSQFVSTPDLPGQQRAYQYAKAFSLEGHRVTLWRSSFSHWGRKETLNDERPFAINTDGSLNIMNIKTRPLYYRNDHRRLLNMLSFAYELLKISKTFPAPDVVIATYPSPFAAFAANKIAARHNAKYILEIGDLWPQVWIERKAFPRYHPFIVLLSALEKYLYKRTSIFVSSLPYVNEYLKEKGVAGHKFAWVPNGIDLDDFKLNGAHEALREDVGDILYAMHEDRQKNVMSVIYVGGIGVGNRVDCIVQAAGILKDKGEDKISFHIIGDGHSKKDIMRYVSDNNLDAVKVWPPVVRKAVPLILKHADAGILCLHNNPVYRYGVNLNKLYDYMASGLPVVFSAEVRNNLVEHYRTGITVPPSDPGAIAAALQRIKAMAPDERSLMGKRGHQGIAEDYDVQKLSKRYLEFIES